MDTKTASTRTLGLLTLFDMHTDFFRKAIEGVNQNDLHQRLNTQANHMAWLAGSAINQRYMMIADTHPGRQQTDAALFAGHQGIQKDARYPDAKTYRKDWDTVSPLAREVLVSLDDAKLDSLFEEESMRMPYYDLVAFTIYREANIIGQLILWRRLLNYPGIRYDD